MIGIICISEGGICTKLKIGSALLILTIIVGLSCAGEWDFNPKYADRNVIKYKYINEEDVEGNGYMMVRDEVNTNNLSLLEYMHGSGSIDYAYVMNATQKTTHGDDDYYTINKGGGWTLNPAGANSMINFTIQKDIVQSPTGFAFANGWYAARPIVYDSFLKEKTVAKSYQEAIVMHHQLEYARAYKGDIAVDLNCTGPTYDSNGVGRVGMRIEDYVTQGTVHIGQLLTDTVDGSNSFKTQGWRKPIIDMDNDYVGDFHIKKNMMIEIEKANEADKKDWLPCCFGGYFDVDEVMRKPISEEGIFDCTCRNTSISTYKPKWNTTMAQFPNDVYAKKP